MKISTKSYKILILSMVVILLLGSILPTTTFAATEAEVADATETGLAWLASQQHADGYWYTTHRSVGETGAALAVLGYYAEMQDKSPLDPSYEYSENIKKGLDYLFASAIRDTDNNLVHWGTDDVYSIGPVLMGICETGAPDEIVDTVGSVLNGMTYKEVAEEIVNAIDYAQIKSGPGIGMWYYSFGATTGDMSISGWVTLGLGYAKEKFGITLPQDMMDLLDQGIDLAQWTSDPSDPRYGGVGYTSDSTTPYSYWINIYKTGHLIYMMALVGDTVSSERLQRSLDFIERFWDTPNSGLNGYDNEANGFPDVGWRGGPGPNPNPLPSYIATVTVMKGLIAFGINEFPDGSWQDEFNDVIVANQNSEGYWDQGGYPTYPRNMSTIWALMTMMRATSSKPVTGISLNYLTISFNSLGGSTTLVANVQPADADNTNVIWSSSDPSVATVVDGVVTPVGVGTAVITATTEDGGYQASCTVTVNASGDPEEPEEELPDTGSPIVWNTLAGIAMIAGGGLIRSRRNMKNKVY